MSARTLGIIELKGEDTDGAALLESSLAPLMVQCAEQMIELRVVSDVDVPHIDVDREKIAWAISVIVGNALRYLKRGTEDQVGGSVLVHLTAQAGGSEVAIAVQDDGPGMSKEKLSLLFERGPGEAHAPALALSLVTDIARAHGGRVTLDSRNGREEHYTCVTLVLPSAGRK